MSMEKPHRRYHLLWSSDRKEKRIQELGRGIGWPGQHRISDLTFGEDRLGATGRPFSGPAATNWPVGKFAWAK